MFKSLALSKMLRVHSDPYRFQRLALLPTNTPLPTSEIHTALQGLLETERQQLLALIIEQGLQFFWLEALHHLPDSPFVELSRDPLKRHCFRSTILYLPQKKALIELDQLFDEEHIPYVIFKGAHIREIIYDNPAFRSSADIDILVSPNEKIRAIRTLCATGYTLEAKLANVSNEVTLVKDAVHLDLHWHIMRPGRPRIDLTDLFLQSRQRCGFYWALDITMSLLVLLTHPVFTEYSTGPGSSVMKLVDLRRWISQKEIDWKKLQHLLDRSGMQTAAWITATILADLTGCHLPPLVYDAITPQGLKRFLLQGWLNLNLSSKLIDYPLLPKYIFTLLAHDCLKDVLRFIRIYRADKQKNNQAMEQLQSASQDR